MIPLNGTDGQTYYVQAGHVAAVSVPKRAGNWPETKIHFSGQKDDYIVVSDKVEEVMEKLGFTTKDLDKS